MEKAREIGRVLGLICLGVLTIYTIIVYFTYIKGWGEPVGYEMIEIKLMTMHEPTYTPHARQEVIHESRFLRQTRL